MKKIIITVLLLVVFMTCVNNTQAQGRKVMYLQTYDWAPYHFGIFVGVNFMDYTLNLKPNYQNVIHTNYEDIKDLAGTTENGFQSYQIISVTRDTIDRFFRKMPLPGFSVGVIGDLRLGNYFNLRMIPTFSLSEINVDYTIQINANDTTQIVAVSHNDHVNCLELPLHIKYRSKRYNNVGAYLVGGLNPKLYFTSKKHKNNVDWINTKPFDLALEMGVGFDFYNPWFKMGVEVKMGFGLLNTLKKEEEQVYFYGHPLEKLKNKQLQVSLTFE